MTDRKGFAVTLLETYFELPHRVGVTIDSLGRDYSAQVDGMAVTIRLPRIEPSETLPSLVAPDFANVFADDGFSSEVLANLHWGIESVHDSHDKSLGTAWISAVGLTTECEAGDGQAAANRLTDAMDDWWPSVCDWIEVLTRQVHAAPSKTLILGPHHPIWAKTDREVKRLYRQSPLSVTFHRDDSPDAPVALTVDLLEAALTRTAAGPPPTEWLLIRDGRLAHQSGSRRLAVIDAGTAVELAITKLLRDQLQAVPEDVFEQLLDGHRMLGRRAALLKKFGGTLPADTQAKLVDPRNRATHNGANPPAKESYDALHIAAEIVEAAYPLASYRQA